MDNYAVKLIIWKDKETWRTSDLNRCIRGSGISTYTPCAEYSGATTNVAAESKTQAKLKAHAMFSAAAGHVEILTADFIY